MCTNVSSCSSVKIWRRRGIRLVRRVRSVKQSSTRGWEDEEERMSYTKLAHIHSEVNHKRWERASVHTRVQGRKKREREREIEISESKIQTDTHTHQVELVNSLLTYKHTHALCEENSVSRSLFLSHTSHSASLCTLPSYGYNWLCLGWCADEPTVQICKEHGNRGLVSPRETSPCNREKNEEK